MSPMTHYTLSLKVESTSSLAKRQSSHNIHSMEPHSVAHMFLFVAEWIDTHIELSSN